MEAADIKGLLGLLLVDGSLNQYRTPTGGYVQLTLTGGITESAFLDEKVAEFRQFIPTKAQIVPYKTAPRYTALPNKQGIVDDGPRHTTVLRFRVSTNKLRPIYNLLYPNGNRQITQNVLDLLGASAASWAWAEGARLNQDGSVVLARVGTTDLEAELISDWLQVLTGASSDELFDEKLQKPRLIFAPEEAAKAADALRSYAPPSRAHLFRLGNESSADQDRTLVLSGERANEYSREQEAAVA